MGERIGCEKYLCSFSDTALFSVIGGLLFVYQVRQDQTTQLPRDQTCLIWSASAARQCSPRSGQQFRDETVSNRSMP